MVAVYISVGRLSIGCESSASLAGLAVEVRRGLTPLDRRAPLGQVPVRIVDLGVHNWYISRHCGQTYITG